MLRADGINFHKKRALIDLDSKLRDIPPVFARDILPKISWYGFEPCWIWFGSVDQKGYPILRRVDAAGKKQQFMARRLVASCFWTYPKDAVIKLSCESINCLNPNHFIITRDRWRK